jgi:dephospho-CoA kinase
MKIIAFTGMPCSGKTEAVNIAKEMNIPVIRMGDVVWEEVKSRGLEQNDKNVGKIANQMRDEHGKDIWARRTVEKIKSLGKKECIIIDGIRNIEEIDIFKKELSDYFTVIAIDASPQIRQKRVLSRGRRDDSNNINDIKERDKRELGWGLGAVIVSADILITNEGSRKEFQEKIKDILHEFLKR